MAINAYGQNLATNGVVGTATTEAAKDKTKLGKDDFMHLLLVELQHQDPTEPMDSEKILSQTSQLATLESAENTNNALSDLATSLGTSQQFNTIAAIGKRADLGSDAISHDKGSATAFEMYFSEDVYSGTIEISDLEGNLVSTIDIQQQKDEDGNLRSYREAGVYQFDWDGLDQNGNSVDSGIYRVNAKYLSGDAQEYTSRVGAYPIESVRFDGGEAQVKLGSSYVPLSQIKEVY